MSRYQGVIRVEDSGIVLETGGVRVRIEGAREAFEPLDGVLAHVEGEQEGDTIRRAAPVGRAESAVAASDDAGGFAPAIEAVRRSREALQKVQGVFGVRPGIRRSRNGQAGTPAVVVVLSPGVPAGELPSEIDGVPVDVRTATPLEQREGLEPLSVWESLTPEAAEAEPALGYKQPASLPLDLTEVRNISCHVGPDSGWSTLKSFLDGTATSLTVAMYEFYADHIIDAILRLGEETDATLTMILQVSGEDAGIEDRLRESWGNRLDFAPASVSGPRRVFANSYHTKVAVRDSSALWLSSGNWNPTSQPLIKPGSEQVLYSKGNREWHVVIEDEGLARLFEEYIRHDIRQARDAGAPETLPAHPDLLVPETFFEPEAAVIQDHPFAAKTFGASGPAIKVMPLMSPDNYADEILSLIKGAERSLYLQFSYIRYPPDDKLGHIVQAIGDKMQEGLDVRVLVSRNQKPEHSELLMAKRGWRPEMFRRQTSRMHNKGVLVDGRIAVVGSHNWSSDGVQRNRDASLVFYSRPIAQYFTEVFLFDWDNLSASVGGAPEFEPVLAPESGATPLGMVRIPWKSWFDE